MIHVLTVEQYIPASKVYIEILHKVLSENDIIYPDLNGALNLLLSRSPNIPYEVYGGVVQEDGWSYYKSQVLPSPSGFPVVALPENDAQSAPVPAIPGDYEIRARVVTTL